MKLQRALAILALLAVAILPVAAAPAVVTGDVYTEAITDGTNWNAYADWNVYVNAAMDDWSVVYLNIGRQYQSFISTGTTAVNVENINLQYMYGKTNLAKFFALDKMLTLNVLGGYYYTTNGAYENKDMFDSAVRLRQRTTESNWWMEVQAGLPGLFTLKAGVAPVVIPANITGTTTNYNAFAFSNDWEVVGYTNQAIPGLGTIDAEVGYKANKQFTSGNPALDKGIFLLDADAVLTFGALKATVGLGMEYDLSLTAAATVSPLTYGATARATYYLDDKSTTWAGAGFGVKGYPSATDATYALRYVEIDVFCTPLPIIDIKNCTQLDLAGTAGGLRSLDTMINFNIGTATDLAVGYLYSVGVNNASDATFYDTGTFYTLTGTTKNFYSGPYVKMVFAY